MRSRTAFPSGSACVCQPCWLKERERWETDSRGEGGGRGGVREVDMKGRRGRMGGE